MPDKNHRKTTYDVFISYRRKGGADKARLFQHALSEKGLKVFIDVDELGSGYFDERLLDIIAETPNFLLILSPDFLHHCNEPDDWLRKEIEQAIKTGRNIVPVLDEGFVFPNDGELPESIRTLPRYGGLPYHHHFFKGMTDKLVQNFFKSEQELSCQEFSKNTGKEKFKTRKCGKLVHKMCDRDEQVAICWDFFTKSSAKHPESPHFYFIHGDRGEGHESFVRRLMKINAKKYAEDKCRSEKADIACEMVGWPSRGNLETRKLCLKRWLFLAMDEGHADAECSVNNLPFLCEKQAIVAFCHSVDISNWRKQDTELFRWYVCEHWAELESDEGTPLFLIFFNLKYPASRTGRVVQKLRKKLGCDCFCETSFKDTVSDIRQSSQNRCLCSPEIELTPVQQDELERWFFKYLRKTGPEWDKKIKAILRKCKTMEAIEGELEKLVEHHNRQWETS